MRLQISPALVASPPDRLSLLSRHARPPLVRCSAIEKFGNMKPPKYDLAAKQVKETMDKRYAPNWCCIIGPLHSFERIQPSR